MEHFDCLLDVTLQDGHVVSCQFLVNCRWFAGERRTWDYPGEDAHWEIENWDIVTIDDESFDKSNPMHRAAELAADCERVLFAMQAECERILS